MIAAHPGSETGSRWELGSVRLSVHYLKNLQRDYREAVLEATVFTTSKQSVLFRRDTSRPLAIRGLWPVASPTQVCYPSHSHTCYFFKHHITAAGQADC